MLGLFGKKYKCDTCGASFKSQNELMEHGKIHMHASQAGSFKCQACGMSFPSQAELKQHSQRVHGM
jgi:DNA-directed RNA polymerase subunit RPC12/RpoP